MNNNLKACNFCLFLAAIIFCSLIVTNDDNSSFIIDNIITLEYIGYILVALLSTIMIIFVFEIFFRSTRKSLYIISNKFKLD